MSTPGEPVSAYGVFKAAKDMADNKKKSNKKQNGSVKAKQVYMGKVKKLACAPATGGTKAAGKLQTLNMSGQAKTLSTKTKSSSNSAKNKQTNGKKSTKTAAAGKKTQPANFKGSEVVNLVDQLYTDDAKKLTKAEQKKKKDLEEYLVNQLEMDDANLEEAEDDSFESEDEEGSEEEGSYSDSDVYSDEYSINESGSYTDEETGENEDNTASYTDQESSSTNEDDNQAAEALAQAILAKANKKRKSPETTQSKTKSVSIEAKKSKKVEETKPAARKSLPATKTDKVINEETKRRRSSLASIDDFSKKSTPKTANSKISTTANVKLEPLSPPANIVKLNSIEEGKRAFKWLLNPVTVDDFFAKYWEQKACLIKRQQSNYFGHLISFEAIDQMLLKNHVEFTKNIDVTSYKNGVRETLNPEGRAMPPVVWDHYGQGCSIRLLNPQTFLPGLFTLSTTMQEYFHCLVGANAYLTPPNSQGFAPHYDDIEAFVLQIEGRKRWKLYKPRNTSEILPRYSSKNFTQQEIGKPVLEEVLEPGDVLYFPRGTIHQACTEPGYHSLHITLSVYQKQSFADLFEKMLPLMLQKAIASSVDLRRGLPLHAWQHAGIAYSDNDTKERADLTKKVTQLMHKCLRDLPLQEIMDAGIDQLAKKFQHEALPPEILPAEKLRTVFGSRSRTNERGECECDYDIDERTNVRLLRANILRLVEEEEKIRIYYYLDNSKEYCEYEPNFIEIEAMEAASVEVLIKSYPQYVGVSQLPLHSDDQKITLVTALWERGLLMMEKPFR
ncbi:bifunctional lysine-specific demethylase and histidyl-hydroxylase NO66 isoform X2 [Lucilia sericata]|nr:bifunctional lysine-specific demethylase and histidyl-hydroxylase NO66 isoform X2 [Lucilia sericata]XP_037813413.1 bifunctional lysine-specific demethylase and histidyl-hydroxylase NO66 isoform X2 [Lucilia sericata]